MTDLAFEHHRQPYADIPVFGPEHPFERLRAEKHAAHEGFPLATPEVLSSSVSSWRGQDRAAVAVALGRINPHLPAPPPEARYVVAGQQVGLLTGPLYTFLKAVTVVALAQRIEENTRKNAPDGDPAPVLPLFWMASEDHDVNEVNRVVVADRQFVHEFKGKCKRGGMPQVADIDIAEAREPLLQFLRETLRPTEFTAWLTDTVASADFANYATCFRDLLRDVFAEFPLRFADPIALRPLTAPALAELAANWPEVVAALGEGSRRLKTAGFAPPLDAPGIFGIVEGCRVAVEFGEGRARLPNWEGTFTELAEEIRRRPFEFSPNAALRPVAQDAALPVAATIGGPTELLYLWQIDPIYGVLGARRSPLRPRISATFVESKIRRAAEKAGLWPDRLFEVRRDLESAVYLDAAPDDARTAAVAHHAESLLTALDALLSEGPPNWLGKTRERLGGQIEKLVARLREDRKEEARLAKSRLLKIAEAVLPRGKPQERLANLFDSLNLHGPEFVRRAVETLDPFADAHQIVAIATAPEEESPSWE